MSAVREAAPRELGTNLDAVGEDDR